MDIHLSHVAQFVEYGFLGKMDVALIEVTAILEDGRVVPSSSLGNNKTWIDCAERIILEVNSWQPMALEGMHDVFYGLEPPPNRKPIPLLRPGDRIGSPYLNIPPEKIVGIVLTDSPDRNSAFKAPDEVSKQNLKSKTRGGQEYWLSHARVARGRTKASAPTQTLSWPEPAESSRR